MKRPASRVAAPVALALALAMSAGSPALAAHTDPTPTASELEHAALARQTGAEGMVLLDNAGSALPVSTSTPIALFGVGAYQTVKGGTGSGDTNNRATVGVRQGLEDGGYSIVTSAAYWDAMTALYDSQNSSSGGGGSFGGWGSVDYAAAEVALTASSAQPTAATDTAVYIIARNSGEGNDRSSGKGDYLLTDIERGNLELLGGLYSKVIVVLNVGAVVDTQFYKDINAAVEDPAGGPALDSLLLMSQAGGEGGNALFDVVSGAVNPSGKTVDTWASAYSYYPASETFALADLNSTQEDYTEGIYVGYRYFDSFYKALNPASPQSVVNYPFGYGLSYTTFSVTTDSVTTDSATVTVKATVANTGSVAGKEVVQVYFSAPQTGLDKPYQELAGYAKTDTLAPGKAQQLTITFNVSEMSSYNETKAAYELKGGDYAIRVGDSSRDTSVAAVLQLGKTVITEQLSNQVDDQKNASQLHSDPADFYTYPGEAAELAAAPRVALNAAAVPTVNNASAYAQSVSVTSSDPLYAVDGSLVSTTTAYVATSNAANWEGTGTAYQAKTGETVQYVSVSGTPTLYDVVKGDATWQQLIASLSVDQLAHIVEGVGYGTSATPSTLSANGAAGYTVMIYEALGIASLSLADGPAGLRITQSYTDSGQTYYQYATAWPIGTLLAQTWNRDLIQKVGEAIGEEMGEYGVSLWLAPGMNIHRDPLNGRNFEYYSEDPLVTGQVAAAITTGVQTTPGVGVTLKHYTGNNQETSRSGGNDTIDERALREIYLKGFEIAVKSAQPMAIMSSYNKVNGTCVAGDYDLLTDVLRGEWGFAGTVMTDWGGCGSFVGNMYAGNDLIEPGGDFTTPVTSAKPVAPTFDTNGVPGVQLSGATYSLATGNFALSAGGGTTLSHVVNASNVTGTRSSGTLTGGGWFGPAVLTPSPSYTTVQNAYNDVVDLLAGTLPGLTAAQRAAISVDNVVTDAGGTVTSYRVSVQGDYAVPLRLGDMQRSAMRVLKTVSQSAAFAELAELQGVSGISVPPFSSQFSGLASYVTVQAGAVTDAPAAAAKPADNKAGLNTVVDAASAVGGAAAFSAETWAALQSALATAKAVAADPAATQAQVDAAANAVVAALRALAPAAQYDHSAMEAAIAALQASVDALKAAGTAAPESTTTTATKAVKAGTVTISGKAKVGKKLTAKTAKWTSGVTFKYQWYANGKAIKKATAKTLKLTKSVKGKKITVKVTATKTGYTKASKTSKATKKVTK